MSTLLKLLKSLLRISDNEDDKLIKALIEQCVGWVELECGLTVDVEEYDDWSKGLQSVFVDLVIFRYGVLGKEAIESEDIVELSYSYNVDYPEYLKRRVRKCRKVVFH